MKRFACLSLLALLLLPACGRLAPAQETTAATTVEITTAAPTTTEEPTTVFVPINGEKDGVTWRTIDMSQDTALKTWLEEKRDQYIEKYEDWDRDRSIELSPGKTLFAKDWQVVLKEGSKETLLLQGHGQNNDANYSLPYSEVPYLRDRIDGRYFIFNWVGSYGFGEPYIYDTVTKKEIPIECPNGVIGYYYQLGNNAIYLADARGDECGPYPVVPHLFKADLAQLQTGGKIKAIDMLDDIPLDEMSCGQDLLSKDERYYWIHTDKGLFLIDLEEKTLRTIDIGVYYGGWLAQKDATTFYCYDYNVNTVLELTLPQ